MLKYAYIDEIMRQEGAAACGVLSYAALAAYMGPKARGRVERRLQAPRSVIVAAFPYYAGEREGNLSVYARGLDYHIGVMKRLQSACAALKEVMPDAQFVPGTDNSPLPEVQAACLAGIGMIGQHGLLICPPYGSYVFLGTILTDVPLDLKNEAGPSVRCMGCGKCIEACPAGALRNENGIITLEASVCYSSLTQKKGELTSDQAKMLAEHPYIWGCDLCQNACPYNQNVAISPLSELTGQTEAAPYLRDLTPEQLEDLTEETFREKYGNRAFAWRGLQVLKRNLNLHKKRWDVSY